MPTAIERVLAAALGESELAAKDMGLDSMDRRTVLATSLAWAALITSVRSGLFNAAALAATPAEAPREAFSLEALREMARKLSESEFVKTSLDLPEPFGKLSYDQYRDIRFRPEKAIWKGDRLDVELQFFPMGWLYDTPVDIWLVEDREASLLKANGQLFALGPLVGEGPEEAPYGFSGFRLHGPLNRADYFDEYAVFQGASYLRAVGRDQNYGTSARGLAINTARPGGEEFPYFRSFWIEKPKSANAGVTVHALLDSPSVAGAYTFMIRSGETTEIDVDLTLYPRKDIPHVGIAPLTSMFLHGPGDPSPIADFRPAVHDSGGLAVLNGSDERLWRPLVNHKTLQVSAFVDKNPKGFGLAQRARNFDAFEDLEAHYERRPTVWVEPKEAWGEGFIELVEIPVDVEIHDNIAVFWKPSNGLPAGGPHTYSYRLYWGQDVPAAWSGARVAKTRVGRAKNDGNTFFVVDFAGPAVRDLRDLPVPELSANPGTVANVVVQRNPEISGLRVTFELNPGDAELVELRLALKAGEQLISESWLYRWTKT